MLIGRDDDYSDDANKDEYKNEDVIERVHQSQEGSTAPSSSTWS